MLRALIALGFCATAICGVKGAPRPPEQVALAAGEDAGVRREGKSAAEDSSEPAPSGAIAPDATAIDPLHDPLSLDAGCGDGGPK